MHSNESDLKVLILLNSSRFLLELLNWRNATNYAPLQIILHMNGEGRCEHTAHNDKMRVPESQLRHLKHKIIDGKVR